MFLRTSFHIIHIETHAQLIYNNVTKTLFRSLPINWSYAGYKLAISDVRIITDSSVHTCGEGGSVRERTSLRVGVKGRHVTVLHMTL